MELSPTFVDWHDAQISTIKFIEGGILVIVFSHIEVDVEGESQQQTWSYEAELRILSVERLEVDAGSGGSDFLAASDAVLAGSLTVAPGRETPLLEANGRVARAEIEVRFAYSSAILRATGGSALFALGRRVERLDVDVDS